MNYKTLTVTASELGDVLDLTDRRIRQLAEEGIFERASRGKYPLASSVQAYVTAQEADESDELRREKIALMRAQRRRIELDNLVRESTAADQDFQDVFIGAISIWWHLHVRPIATWVFEDLRLRGVKDDTLIAGEVQGWIGRLRYDGEQLMLAAAAKARKNGVAITDYDTLIRMIGADPAVDDSPDDTREEITARAFCQALKDNQPS
ncbi:hypothetical protein [Mesorhizobium sp. M0006]|uniref:hypothetical protein n=1 Tax=Mesorhizobium sp. M0006 TaxID=2956838 RepID=UPI00333ADA62